MLNTHSTGVQAPWPLLGSGTGEKQGVPQTELLWRLVNASVLKSGALPVPTWGQMCSSSADTGQAPTPAENTPRLCLDTRNISPANEGIRHESRAQAPWQNFPKDWAWLSWHFEDAAPQGAVATGQDRAREARQELRAREVIQYWSCANWCLSSSSAEGLCLASTKICFRKSLQCSDMWEGSWGFVGCVAILKIAAMASYSAHGGFSVSISTTVQPRLLQSTQAKTPVRTHPVKFSVPESCPAPRCSSGELLGELVPSSEPQLRAGAARSCQQSRTASKVPPNVLPPRLRLLSGRFVLPGHKRCPEGTVRPRWSFRCCCSSKALRESQSTAGLEGTFKPILFQCPALCRTPPTRPGCSQAPLAELLGTKHFLALKVQGIVDPTKPFQQNPFSVPASKCPR